jgi:16S rRNA processing protein RimM
MAPGARLRAPVGELEVVRAVRQAPVSGRERWLVSFRGIEGREQAEALRGAILTAAPLADPDAWWVHDLIGAEIVDAGGTPIGVVDAVEANPASDLLVLADGRVIPLRFVTDRHNGRLTADLPPGLLEL